MTGIQCPECDHLESTVVDTRPVDNMRRRMRECDACGVRYPTFELSQDSMNKVGDEIKSHLRRAVIQIFE